MQREAVEINLIISCAVLSAGVFSGQWRWTLQLFDADGANGANGAIEIDVITMDVLLTACHMGGRALKSLTLLQQAESSGLAGLRALSNARVKELGRISVWPSSRSKTHKPIITLLGHVYFSVIVSVLNVFGSFC